MPPGAWALCLAAIGVPVATGWALGVRNPSLLAFYLWTGSPVCAFVAARHGGRRGAWTALIAGVVVAGGSAAGLAALTSPLPDWRIAILLVAVFAGVALGFGATFERIAAERRDAERRAATDPLTGIANRGRAQRRLDAAFGASGDGGALTVALIEVDRFRLLNDQHGHVAGDRVLRTVARLIDDAVRSGETVGRWSGAEFMVLLPGSTLDDARPRIEAIQTRLAGVDLQWRPVSISGGLASVDAGVQTADGLVSLADQALMRARELGGDRIEVFGADHGVETGGGAAPTRRDPTVPPPARPPTSAPEPTPAPVEVPTLAPPVSHPPEFAGGAAPLVQGAAAVATMPALPETAQPTGPTRAQNRSVAAGASAARIVVVDDDRASLRAFERGLTALGFTEVTPFDDPEGALELVDAHEVDLILLDLHMQPLDGFGVLQRLRPALDEEGFLPVIVLTGERDPKVKERALRMGARDFLTKPIDLAELHARILNLLETRALHRQVREAAHGLEDRVRERTRELEEARADILARLARAAEYRDDATGRHQERVGELSALLAQYMGLDAERIDILRQAAPLHDIGKIGIPDSILRKPGPLTPAEYARMKQHTRLGAELLSGSTNEILETAAVVAASHHERWDGSGYPAGLREEAIPVEGRIVAVADAFDSLTHRRTYKAAVPLSITMERLIRDAGSALDPHAAEALEHLYRTGRLDVFVEDPA